MRGTCNIIFMNGGTRALIYDSAFAFAVNQRKHSAAMSDESKNIYEGNWDRGGFVVRAKRKRFLVERATEYPC